MADSKVIEVLNKGRARELAAITQYMAFHYEMEDQDFGKLAKLWKEIAIVEMKHAEALAERILFLGGTPTSKPDEIAKKGLKVEAQLKVGEKLERDAVKMYNAAIVHCSKAGDQGSKAIFEKLVTDEEEHLDTFQNIQAHLKDLGQAYLATLAGD